MHPKHTHKLYCYVDKTGQDTMGDFFIVAIVVADSHRDDLQRWLEVVERESGKKTKWMKTSDKARHAYIEALIQNELPAQIYAKIYHNTAGSFDELEVLATAQAINLYREENQIGDNYKVTIAIDGASKTLTRVSVMPSGYLALGYATCMESATAQSRLFGWLTPLLSVPPRIYKKHVCNSPSGGDLPLERWSIPMIGPKFPPLTLKIVEHSRYLPTSSCHADDYRVPGHP